MSAERPAARPDDAHHIRPHSVKREDSLSDQSTGPLVYLKLGGSLITDKRRSETPRLDVIQRLAGEIASARRQNPTLRLLIGHGSGSFGHVVGRRYGTRQGVRTSEQWYGFAATGDAAARLNRIVVQALLQADIPAWSIQPSVDLRCDDGRIVAGPLEPVRMALARGLVPLVYGDVALDRERGGTIASTEEIFEWLAASLRPQRIVLAGEVDGVFTGDPQLNENAQLLTRITPDDRKMLQAQLGGSHGVDVTGGMAAKIEQSMRMVERYPALRITICNGLTAGTVRQVLSDPGCPMGTIIGQRPPQAPSAE